ncbi:hypothetical protein DFH27DRAFT_364224 [Peziza echinospora]|nr:hypothetical protein DFH27DRAFT_364224 [Peziza echinospora]
MHRTVLLGFFNFHLGLGSIPTCMREEYSREQWAVYSVGAVKLFFLFFLGGDWGIRCPSVYTYIHTSILQPAQP